MSSLHVAINDTQAHTMVILNIFDIKACCITLPVDGNIFLNNKIKTCQDIIFKHNIKAYIKYIYKYIHMYIYLGIWISLRIFLHWLSRNVNRFRHNNKVFETFMMSRLYRCAVIDLHCSHVLKIAMFDLNYLCKTKRIRSAHLLW